MWRNSQFQPFNTRQPGRGIVATFLAAAAVAASLAFAPIAVAATCTTATTGGNWNTAANWTCTAGGNHVPLATDDVVINRNFTVNVATAAVQSVTMTAGTLTQSSALNTAALPAGALLIQGGAFNSTAAMTIGGVTTISAGTFTPSSASARIFTGLVTISGGIWTGSTRPATFRGGITYSSGTFTAGTGVHTFDTTNQALTGTLSIPSITVTGVTLTNNGTLTVTTALAGNALTNTGTLNIGFAGPPGITTIDATAVGNTVDYNRGNIQTVEPTAYYNLKLSTSNAKTLTGVTSIAGDLTVQGTATMTGNAAFTLTGALNYSSTASSTLTAATPISIGTLNQTAGTIVDNGNTITVTGTGASTWVKAGTFTATGTAIFTGAAPQIGASNFANLTINVGAGNTATLAGNITTTAALTVNANTTLNMSTFTAGVAGNFVVNGTISGSGAITLSGSGTNIDGTGSITNATTLSITTGAKSVLSTANLSFPGTLAISGAITVTNNGTVTITKTPDSITGTVAGSTWVNAANSSLTVSGTLLTAGATPGTLTANANPNTVNYAGAAQTVKTPSAGYNNLSLSGSGTKTMPGALTIGGNFTMSGTAATTAAGAMTITGKMDIGSGTSFNASTFTHPVTGNFIVNGTVSGTGQITLNGTGTSIDGTGSITGTGTLSITTGSKSILNTASLSIAWPIPITGTLTVTNNGAITSTSATGITGTLNTSIWVNAANSSLTVSGPLLTTGATPGTLTASANPNLVNYAGAAQNVKVPSSTYYNLTFSGSNIKTALGSFTVAGDLSITGVTFASTSFTHTVNGNISNTGTHTVTTGKITLSGGTAAHALSGTGIYANLELNDTNGATLSASPSVSSVLTLTSGILTTGANTLNTTANCPGSVSRPGGGGHVAGNLLLKVPAGGPTTCVHDVGDATTYRPISLTFPAGTTTGNLTGTVSLSAGDHGSITGSDLDATQDVNRFWTLTNSGVTIGAGGYSATFTFVAGDIDAGSDTTQFEVARYNGSTWTTETAGTRTPTSTQATGLTAFSDFAVGQRKINNFLIAVPGAAVSTCNAASVTFTARNSSNQVLTNYRGNVNLSTSTSHGDWASGGSTNGTFTPGTADSGAATYVFASADKGIATFNLTNKHADDLTASMTDTVTLVTSTSGTIQFRGNVFVISTPDALGTTPVAGRDHAMSVQMNQGASCATAVTTYAGSKTLKASISRNGSDPGGTAPTIGAVSLTNSPTTANVTLTFTSGVASFNLSTTDVGKYDLNLTDDTRTFATGADITGTSSTLTTRPFAVVINDIKQGGTNNPNGTATSGVGGKFIAAADSFEATVGAYRYNLAVDSGSGVPSNGATFAQVTFNGKTPSYKWPIDLSAATPITPSGETLGALGNGSFLTGDFSGGAATKTTLTYSEVGSFTLSGTATGFLGTSGVDLTSANNTVRIYNSSGAENGVVGRFFPDHFTLTASSLTPACAGGSFTYMGQPNFGYTLGIEARNKSDAKTNNYINSVYSTGTVALQAENSNNGTDIASRLPALTGSWAAGAYSFSTTTATFSRPGSPDGPFDSLQIGVTVSDPDSIAGSPPVLAARDMNPATTGACLPATTCTGKSIGTTIVRFGRLTIGNASGSPALPLTVPIEAQYWNGKSFVTNTLDACTTISASVLGSDVAMGTYSTGLNPAPNCKTAISNGGVLASGRRLLRLSTPTGNASGNVTLTVNLGAVASGNTCTTSGAAQGTATTANRPYLQGGSGFNQNPSGRATFGVYRGSEEQIHRQENY